ncbi:MAG: hypothetical protein HOA08_22230, partial [Rhodospirillaceae bacterium]|nr:hypothetical protein [Rhodospirillaceae bacterium]
MDKLSISQDVAGCLQPGGLSQDDLAPLLRQCEAMRQRLRDDLAAGPGPLAPIAIARQRDDLAELRQVAQDWRKRFRRVV